MILKIHIGNKETLKYIFSVIWSIEIYLQSTVVTQIQMKSEKWVCRRDILDVLGNRGIYLLKLLTNKYLFKGNCVKLKF